MAETTIAGSGTNLAHLAHLLADEVGELGVRVVGPDADGNVTIRADKVSADRLKKALLDVDPEWSPPAERADPDPVGEARAKVHRLPPGPQREALTAILDAIDRT